jgi:hypothetical protein
LARETLTLDHSVEDFARPLDVQDIKGQLVEVYDSAAGTLLLKAPANPVLDGGGNVAISPACRHSEWRSHPGLRVARAPAISSRSRDIEAIEAERVVFSALIAPM